MSYMEYTDTDRKNILESVLSRLINGESMRKICLSDGMPDRVTLIRWVYDDAEYATTIARARELQAEGLLDDMAEICQKMEDGELDANSGKAIIWAKQWIAGRMNKKYGDRTIVDANINDYTNMTPEDRRRRLMELQQQIQNAELS